MFIDNSGDIIIGDFGLASRKFNDNVGSVVGTPEYMAPEIFDEGYDKSIDIYAFGMFVLEISTQSTPYSECNGNPLQLYKKITEGEKPKALDRIIDQDLKTFILKCIDLDKNVRPTASELIKDSFLEIQETDNLEIQIKPEEKHKDMLHHKHIEKKRTEDLKEKQAIAESNNTSNCFTCLDAKKNEKEIQENKVIREVEKKSDGIEFRNENSLESKINTQQRTINNISDVKSELSIKEEFIKFNNSKYKENQEKDQEEIFSIRSNNENSELSSIKKLKREFSDISMSKKMKLELLKDLVKINNNKYENDESFNDMKDKINHLNDIGMNLTVGTFVGENNKALSNKMSSVNDPPCSQHHQEVDSFFSLFNENTNRDNHNHLNNLNLNFNEFNSIDPLASGTNINIQSQSAQQRSTEQVNNNHRSFKFTENINSSNIQPNIHCSKGLPNRMYGNYNNQHTNWDLIDYKMDHPQFDGHHISGIEPPQLSIPENNTTFDSKEKTPKICDLEFKFYRDSEDLYIILNGKKENQEKVSSIYPTNVNQFLISAEKEFSSSIHSKIIHRKNELYLWDIRDKLINEVVHEKSGSKTGRKINENNSLLKDKLHRSTKGISGSASSNNQISNKTAINENFDQKNKTIMGKKEKLNLISNTKLTGNNDVMLSDSIWNFRKNYMQYYYNCIDPALMSDHEESIESLKKRQEMELQLMQLWHQRQYENLIKNKKKAQVNSFNDKKQEHSELIFLRNKCKHFSRNPRKASKSQDHLNIYNKDNYLKSTNNFANCDFHLPDVRSSQKNLHDNYKMFANFNKDRKDSKKQPDDWQLFEQIDLLDILHNKNNIKTQDMNNYSDVLSKLNSYEDQIFHLQNKYGDSPQEKPVAPFEFKTNLNKHETPLNLSLIGEQDLVREETNLNIDCISKEQDEIEEKGLLDQVKIETQIYEEENLEELEYDIKQDFKISEKLEKAKEQSSNSKKNQYEKEISETSNLKVNKESYTSQTSSVQTITNNVSSVNKALSNCLENTNLPLNNLRSHVINHKSPKSNSKSITNNNSSLFEYPNNLIINNNSQETNKKNTKNVQQDNCMLNLTDTTCHKSGKTIEKGNKSDHEQNINHNSIVYDSMFDPLKSSHENYKKQQNYSVSNSFGENDCNRQVSNKTINFIEESSKINKNKIDSQYQTPQNQKELQNSFENTSSTKILYHEKNENTQLKTPIQKVSYKTGSQNLPTLENIKNTSISNNDFIESRDLQTPSFNSKFDRNNITSVQSLNHKIDQYSDEPNTSNVISFPFKNINEKKAEKVIEKTNILEMFSGLDQQLENERIPTLSHSSMHSTDNNLKMFNFDFNNVDSKEFNTKAMQNVVSETNNLCQKKDISYNTDEKTNIAVNSMNSILENIQYKDLKNTLPKEPGNQTMSSKKSPPKNQDTPIIPNISPKEHTKLHGLETLFFEESKKKPDKVPDLNNNQVDLVKNHEMRGSLPISVNEINDAQDVKIVQTCLKHLAFDDKFEANGNYGKYTAYQINKFKKLIGYTEDGEVDHKTFNRLKVEQYKRVQR